MCSLKTTTKRFDRILQTINIAGYTKGSSPRIMDGSTKFVSPNIETFSTDAKAAYDSAVALVNNYFATKCAIVLSNAGLTGGEDLRKITINGAEYTVAEAIECKHAISMLEQLKNRLALQWGATSARVAALEADNERRLDAQIAQLNSKETNEAERDATAKLFDITNKITVVDPLNVAKVIADLEDKIFKFREDVDVMLSESNASTKVTVSESRSVI